MSLLPLFEPTRPETFGYEIFIFKGLDESFVDILCDYHKFEHFDRISLYLQLKVQILTVGLF